MTKRDITGLIAGEEPSSMMRFLAKLRELLKAKFSGGLLTEKDFDEAVRQARSHAGGTARWEKARAEKEAAAAAEGNSMNAYSRRLLGEIVLSEDGRTGQVQIFPAVGTYHHPSYGELKITPAFLNAVKKQFDGKVYQQELPLTIDLEHQTKLSGAAGWVKDVEIKGDRGMWATVEFNDRGAELVGQDAYRYFSPEFYDKWQDPATAKEYTNVLIGGALTNRPFFKGMSPVAMIGGEGVLCFVEAAVASGDSPGRGDGAAPTAEDVCDCMQECMDMLGKMGGKMKPMAAEMQGMLSRVREMCAHSERAAVEGEPDEAGELDAEKRNALQDSQFAYIDSKGGRHLPIHDAAHVRNALARFDQTQFESAAAKAKARAKLTAAAARLGVTVGGDKQATEAITNLQGLYADREALGETPAHVRASLSEAGLSEDEIQGVLTVVGLDDDTGGNTVGMTEDEARQFSEMQGSLRTLQEELTAQKAAREAAEQVARTAAEQVASLQRDANRRTLSEFVRQNRLAFQGAVDGCVDKLEKYQRALGEDFPGYLDEQRSLHERLQASDIFREIGNPAVATGDGVQGEVATLVKAALAANPALTEAEATTKVLSENQALYARYDREQQRQHKRGREV